MRLASVTQDMAWLMECVWRSDNAPISVAYLTDIDNDNSPANSLHILLNIIIGFTAEMLTKLLLSLLFLSEEKGRQYFLEAKDSGITVVIIIQ